MKKICEFAGATLIIVGIIVFIFAWVKIGFLYGLVSLLGCWFSAIIFCALYEILDYLEKIYSKK